MGILDKYLAEKRKKDQECKDCQPAPKGQRCGSVCYKCMQKFFPNFNKPK